MSIHNFNSLPVSSSSLKGINSARRLFVGILVVASIACVVVIGSYLLKFGSAELSPEQSEWAQFGDYMGGTLSSIFSILSFGALLYTLLLQSRVVAQTEQQLTGNVLLDLRKTYSTTEMKSAIQYLINLKEANQASFDANRYEFARTYISSISESSEDWALRRCVSHFYQDAAALIETGCLI